MSEYYKINGLTFKLLPEGSRGDGWHYYSIPNRDNRETAGAIKRIFCHFYPDSAATADIEGCRAVLLKTTVDQNEELEAGVKLVLHTAQIKPSLNGEALFRAALNTLEDTRNIHINQLREDPKGP